MVEIIICWASSAKKGKNKQTKTNSAYILLVFTYPHADMLTPTCIHIHICYTTIHTYLCRYTCTHSRCTIAPKYVLLAGEELIVSQTLYSFKYFWFHKYIDLSKQFTMLKSSLKLLNDTAKFIKKKNNHKHLLWNIDLLWLWDLYNPEFHLERFISEEIHERREKTILITW